MDIPYTKMHGCHNDYIYINNLQGKYPQLNYLDLPSFARKWSHRSTGIGSDGVIVVNPPTFPGNHGEMRMFNADGSEGKMCGNGIRCVAKLIHETSNRSASYKIETLSGIKECFIIDDKDPARFMVKVNMGRPSFLPASIPVEFDDMMVLNEEFDVLDRTFRMSCVSMGNPHCVVSVENLDGFPVERYGREIENNPVFPEKVNVEFIENRNGEIFQRTWERGSGETQACGTGACAVGVLTIMGGVKKSPVIVHLRGGDLQIDWDGLHDVWMTGEAVTESVGNIQVAE